MAMIQSYSQTSKYDHRRMITRDPMITAPVATGHIILAGPEFSFREGTKKK
jgi:hypothetical protein